MSTDHATPERIHAAEAGTLAGLFRERLRRTPERTAYRFYDALNGAWAEFSWGAIARDVDRWQRALEAEGLAPGERVAVMARNSRYWVIFDQAALGMGLVVVPFFTEDRADNVAYMVRDAGVKLLLIGGPAQSERLDGRLRECRSLRRIVSIAEVGEGGDKRLVSLQDWLARADDRAPALPAIRPEDMASIVYTSGTTGRPKGVMLSHRNILSNAESCLGTVPVTADEVFLSFLPLSHMLERTVGYYVPMMAGAVVAHARSIPDLANDLRRVRPEGLISVPRIYERIHVRLNEQLAQRPPFARWLFRLTVAAGWRHHLRRTGRAGHGLLWLAWPLLKRLVADRITGMLGGRLKVAISGGASLSPEIARTFIALGVPILQGYGLTEASPVVSVNRLEDNVPESIGRALPGVEVRIGENDELLVRGANVMMGFWNNPEETARVLDPAGWLHTGDRARMEDGRIYITGRIKEIIVLANGEKVSPADMESAIVSDPLFDQVLIVGEGRPFLSALAVLNEAQWQRFAAENGLAGVDSNDRRSEKCLLQRLGVTLHDFPGYAQVYRLHCVHDAWSVDNGLLTPTLKLRRSRILEACASEIGQIYQEQREREGGPR